MPPDLHIALPVAAAIGAVARYAWRSIGSFTVQRSKDGLDIRLRIRPPYRW